MANLSWICCQLGAREHYAIPRSLHQARQLTYLITDAWVSPQSKLYALPNTLFKSLQDRFHPDLADAPVQFSTSKLLKFEVMHRFHKTGDWERMIARNHWFQYHTLRQLQRIAPRITQSGARPVLFTYSYAALELLRYAKSQGWFTILGQIDPGPVEEQIVIAEHQKHPHLAPDWQPVPLQYWESWRVECELSDRIVVNSTWSKQALEQAGIETTKIDIVPLAYSPPAAAQSFRRTYPIQFSVQRPLRVLFLGQIILRKGIAVVLEAAKLLQNEPIEFWMVGRIGIEHSQALLPNIHWIGPVSRSQVTQYYQQADLFLFPSLSDGFGLTQLEAQAWQLPLITSPFCGEVARDQTNGLILSEITGETITEALQFCLHNPNALANFAQQSNCLGFDLSTIHKQLELIVHS
jgi:glycosyltransferase involved in cell wall biosynthesis